MAEEITCMRIPRGTTERVAVAAREAYLEIHTGHPPRIAFHEIPAAFREMWLAAARASIAATLAELTLAGFEIREPGSIGAAPEGIA